MKKNERRAPHLADANADIDRFQIDLPAKIAGGVGHDEADVARGTGPGQLEPEKGSSPFEVAEVDGVVDVPERVKIAELDMMPNDVPTTAPLTTNLDSHDSLYGSARRERHRAAGAGLQVAAGQRVIEVGRDDPGSVHQPIEIDARFDRHPVEHVHDVFRR